ncbi:MAG: hypothetical protein ACE5H2_08250 [Terriglobia bacterium]
MRKALSGLLLVLVAATVALAQPADRWLHVRVEKSGEEPETLRVNLPLALAEAVLPAIHVDPLRGGKLKLREIKIHEVDWRAVLEAVRAAGEGEFLTIESAHESVRVAKEGGYLIVKVREDEQKNQQVDVKLPFPVVEALLSGEEDELDLVAALRVLSAHGDIELVTVKDGAETVRVWIDSKRTLE